MITVVDQVRPWLMPRSALAASTQFQSGAHISMNGTGSYGFSTNVTGDLALGFSHFRETNGIVRRSIRVELRGQFRF